MDGFHSQNVGSHLRTCPRTGPSMSRHDSGVGIALIHDCGRQNGPLQTVASVCLDIGHDGGLFIFCACPESDTFANRQVFAFCFDAGKTCARGGDASCKTGRNDWGGTCFSSEHRGLETFRRLSS